MEPTTEAAQTQNSTEETGGQDVRADDGSCASGGLDKMSGGKVVVDVSLERQDSPQVLTGSGAYGCNGEEIEQQQQQEEEANSSSEISDSAEDEAYQNSSGVRDELETDGHPVPDEGCEWQLSTSSIFLKSANTPFSLATVLESSDSMTGADMNGGCYKCATCNETGTFHGKAVKDYRDGEESRPMVERGNGLVLEEGSKPRPVNQRRPNVSEISLGIWLKCFLRFFLGSIVEDLITSNPLLTSVGVLLVPISFLVRACGDLFCLAIIIFYGLVLMAIYILLCLLWTLNVIFAVCWHFLQLSQFSTRVAKIIFEFLWDMRSAYVEDNHFCKLLSSR